MITVAFKVIRINARLFVAAGTVGGISIRGGTRGSEVEAVQSFFSVLSGNSGNTDDAVIAVSLLIEGTDISEALKELPSGE